MFNKENSQIILKEFYDNFASRIIIFYPIHENLLKIISNPINKKLFEEFDTKYPSFFNKINEMIYCIDKELNDIIVQKLCYCGNIKHLKNYVAGYKQYCSRKCMCNSPEIKTKKKITTQQHYGVDNPAKSSIIQIKIHDTILEKYGDRNAYIDNIREKMKQTCLDKYGVDHNFKVESIKSKIGDTCLEKYGVKYACQSDVVKEKTKKTCNEKYGGNAPSSSIDIKNKIKETNNKKYNNDSIQQIHLTNLSDMNEEYIRSNFIKDGYFLVEEFCDYFSCSLTYGVVKRKEFDITEKVKTSRQKTQNRIYDWIVSLGIIAVNKDRTLLNGKEVDLYMPEHKLAIEYDGLMFHSFGKSKHSMFNNSNDENEQKNYHLIKTEECERQNVQLLHIFEDEWINKQEIWKSVILNKLNLSNKLHARKCTIKEVSNNEKSEFLINNHLQGNDKSSIRIGLYYHDKLVSIMTFGKSRYNKKYEYELIRFCSCLNTSVVGGASKLIRYFINTYKPSSIISYANRRWSNGNLYNQLGFEHLSMSIPNYFYFNSDLTLKSRLQFQKHKLSKLNNYADNLTETENMYNNGFRKIYDCGNHVFALNLLK